MSIDAMRWAWTRQDITPAQKLVLLSLADRADENNRCWPSISRLTRDTSMERKAVFRALDALEKAGLVVVEKSNGRTNVYMLSGVEGREDGTSAQNGTGTQNGTSAQNGTGTSPINARVREPKVEPKENPQGLRCDEEDLDATPAAPPSQAAYVLPLRSKSGGKPRTFPVTRELFETWLDAYPLVDVRAELKKIKAWLVSNPKKRPASYMPKFVNSWLKGEQNHMAGQEARLARPVRDGPRVSTMAQQQVADRDAMAKMLLAHRREHGDTRPRNDADENSCASCPALPAGGIYPGAVDGAGGRLV